MSLVAQFFMILIPLVLTLALALMRVSSVCDREQEPLWRDE